MTGKIVVFVTCSKPKDARHIAKLLVGRNLAACVQEIGGRIRSTYRWKGKVESAKEILLLIKTTRRKFPEVAKAVKQIHSYEVPEIIALPIEDGSEDYLNWIAESVREKKTRR